MTKLINNNFLLCTCKKIEDILTLKSPFYLTHSYHEKKCPLYINPINMFPTKKKVLTRIIGMNVDGIQYVSGVETQFNKIRYIIKSISYLKQIEFIPTREDIHKRSRSITHRAFKYGIVMSDKKTILKLAVVTLKEDFVKEFNENIYNNIDKIL